MHKRSSNLIYICATGPKQSNVKFIVLTTNKLSFLTKICQLSKCHFYTDLTTVKAVPLVFY